MGRVFINGKEVTNPAARFGLKLLGILIGGLIASVVLFLVLPAVGVVVLGTVGIALGVVLLVLLAVPVIAVGGSLLGILCAPLAVLSSIFGGRGRHRDWD